MKTTIRIAKLELNNLFYSPLAWLVLVGFSIFTAYEIIPPLKFIAERIGMYNSEAGRSITESIFTGEHRTYFAYTRDLLMVLIPLISMGVISREASSGSIKLLYSSPIKLGSIVVGKYLGVMVFVSMLMSISLLAIFIGNFTVEHLDFGRLISVFIHLYLFAALIAAIGVFISTFSAYPIVDAVATIALVYGLDLLYGLVDEVPVVNVIMYWIAPSQQMEYAYRGLVTSQSLLYFVVLIILFVSWAYLRMVLKRQTSTAKWMTRAKMTALLLFAMGVIYTTTKPALLWYKDMSATQVNVLSPVSKEALADLKDQPIKITTYVNLFGEETYGLMPKDQFNAKAFFHKYYLEYPQIEMDFVYYYNPPQLEAYQDAVMFGKRISLEETIDYMSKLLKMDKRDIHHIDELGLSDDILKNYANFNFRILESKGKQSLLKYRFDDMRGWPDQAQITAAFKRLVDKSYKIAFVEGHRERRIDVNEKLARVRRAYYQKVNYPENYDLAFSSADERHALKNNGFDVVSLSLGQEVPSNVDVLMIAEPKSEFSEQKLANLKKYADKGGHLIITSGRGNEKVMNPIVAEFGVEFLPGMLVNDNPNYPADFNLAEPQGEFKESLFFKPDVQVIKATALKVDENKGFKSFVLLSSKGKETWMDATGPNEFGEIAYNEAEGDQKASLPIAVQLERTVNNKSQKVLIASDAEFLSNARRYQAPKGIRVANARFMSYLSKWLTGGDYPLDIPRPEDKDLRTTIAWENIIWLNLLLYGFVPGLFVFFGGRMLLKRMRN